MRIDKWLWVARFYRTRSKAKAAVLGGKVHVNGDRSKAARSVQLGDRLEITRGTEKSTMVITAFSERRGDSELARSLYEETPESVANRLKDTANRRMVRAGLLTPKLKPSKTARRAIRELKQTPDG